MASLGHFTPAQVSSKWSWASGNREEAAGGGMQAEFAFVVCLGLVGEGPWASNRRGDKGH